MGELMARDRYNTNYNEVILDGEALGRDLETGVCARFGTNQSIAKLERTIIERCVDPKDAGAVAGIVDDIKAETVEGGARGPR